MRLLLWVAFLCLVLNINAQPTIGADAIVEVGEEEPTTFLAFTEQTWESGISGMDVSWDYSGLSMGDNCDYVALDPAESPYFDSFPDSDIYFVCSFSDAMGQASEFHTFYNIEGSILQLAGNVTVSISNPSFDIIYTVYTDPIDWGTFPYTFEDMSEDDFEARVTTYLGNQTIFINQTGTSTQEVDSYGTLTTPAGTFENTIRVKRVELAENTIPGVPFGSPQESYRYTWYAENENGVILNLDSIVVKDFSGTVQSTSYNGSYRIMGPTATAIKEIEGVELSVYPNPATEALNVEMLNISDYDVKIFSSHGKVLPYSILNAYDSQLRLQLDPQHFPKGIYVLRLLPKEGDKIISKIFTVLSQE